VCAKLQCLESKEYVKTFSDREHLTEEAVDNFANHYLKDIANGSLKEGDWIDVSSDPGPKWGRPFETYAVSKTAVIAFVSVLHNTFFSQPGSGKKINIFSCCPGYVATSVNTSGGNSVEVGADTPVWLALHSPEGGSGKFWAERELIFNDDVVLQSYFSRIPSPTICPTLFKSCKCIGNWYTQFQT
jgi:NAD(P)-dependent dehydrogenase (short-subunit alcohol dehydrogenase family)